MDETTAKAMAARACALVRRALRPPAERLFWAYNLAQIRLHVIHRRIEIATGNRIYGSTAVSLHLKHALQTLGPLGAQKQCENA